MTLHRFELREVDAKGRTLKRTTRYVERRGAGAVTTGNAVVPAGGGVSEGELADMRQRITDLERRVADLEARPTPLVPVLSETGAPMPAPDLGPALGRIASLERDLAGVKASTGQIPEAAAVELEQIVRAAGARTDARLSQIEAALAALGAAAEEAAKRKS